MGCTSVQQTAQQWEVSRQNALFGGRWRALEGVGVGEKWFMATVRQDFRPEEQMVTYWYRLESDTLQVTAIRDRYFVLLNGESVPIDSTTLLFSSYRLEVCPLLSRITSITLDVADKALQVDSVQCDSRSATLFLEKGRVATMEFTLEGNVLDAWFVYGAERFPFILRVTSRQKGGEIICSTDRRRLLKLNLSAADSTATTNNPRP